jgi:DNA polymerase-3 subunit delta
MKVYPEKLAGSLKKGTAPLYIVSGDEPLLVQEACDLIRAELKEKGFEERDLYHVETGFDWDEVFYSVNSMSLFAEKKLIEIRMPTAKPGDKGGKALTALVEQLGSDTVLLLVLPRVDAGTQKTKWFKSIESAGAFVQVWPIESQALPRWLEERFRREGLQVTREAVLALTDRIEGNLLAAVQEIQRLKLVARDNSVDLDLVLDGVADNARFDVFKLIDTSLGGDSAKLVRMIQALQAEGVELLFLNSMLARELRGLETMSLAMLQGQPMREALKKGRVWDKRTSAVSKALNQHNPGSLRRLQEGTGSVDRMVKGLMVGDPWLQITSVLLELSGARMPRPLQVS